MIIIKYEVVKWIATFSNGSYEPRFIEEAWNKTKKAHGYCVCMLYWKKKTDIKIAIENNEELGIGILPKLVLQKAMISPPTYLIHLIEVLKLERNLITFYKSFKHWTHHENNWQNCAI